MIFKNIGIISLIQKKKIKKNIGVLFVKIFDVIELWLDIFLLYR